MKTHIILAQAFTILMLKGAVPFWEWDAYMEALAERSGMERQCLLACYS